MEGVGAREGDKADRVKWILLSRSATLSREKPKEDEEEEVMYNGVGQACIIRAGIVIEQLT